MDPLVHRLYSLVIIISGFTVIMAPFGMVFLLKALKTMHFNLKFIVFVLGLLWCTFPFGGLSFYFILDLEDNPPQLYTHFQYQIGKNIWATSGYAFRVVETAICFERLLATIFFRSYENHCIFYFYPFFAIFVSLSLSACFSLLFNILHIPALAVYIFLFTDETINFVLLIILRQQNHKLRKLSNSNRALLTSKYQLIENIKSLNLLLPQACISFVISNVSIISSFVVGEIYEPIRVPLFFSFYSINVIIISIYWICQSKWFRRKKELFRQMFAKAHAFQSFPSNSVSPLRATIIRTTLGQSVKAQQTIDEHFIGLKAMWK